MKNDHPLINRWRRLAKKKREAAKRFPEVRRELLNTESVLLQCAEQLSRSRTQIKLDYWE